MTPERKLFIDQMHIYLPGLVATGGMMRLTAINLLESLEDFELLQEMLEKGVLRKDENGEWEFRHPLSGTVTRSSTLRGLISNYRVATGQPLRRFDERRG